MNIFVFDNASQTLKINDYEILLVKEFAKLWDQKRNICKEDKTGQQRIRARKELTYIYLTLDFKSPYFKYAERDKHEAALQDSGLTEDDIKDDDFRAAYHKYDEIQNTDPILELIKTANKTLRKTKVFLDSIDFINDVDADGRPLYKPKDVMADIGSISKMRNELQALEVAYKENLVAATKLRGDNEPGFQDE